MDRRKFLSVSVAGIAATTLGPLVPDADAGIRKQIRKSDAEEYSVVILGDTHYDTEPASVYHSEYTEPKEWRYKLHCQEFVRNGEMWRERCPRMLARAARLVDGNTKMIFQTGDLIQGDCDNPVTHKKMLDDVLTDFKAKLGGLPFVTVVGNHDIRGKGAEEAYREYMPARMSAELGKKISKTTFSFMIGPDAFIVLDFNNPDDAEVEKLLRDTEGSRYTFVLVHGPLMPYDSSGCRWFFHGSAKDDDIRKHFRKLFAERDVIALCGHTHRTELADWFGDGGRITQMTMNSVWSKEERAKFNPDCVGPSSYGTLYKNVANADGSPVKNEDAVFAEYRAGLKRYVHANCAGSYKLNVTRHGVVVEFYGGDSEAVTENFVLR